MEEAVICMTLVNICRLNPLDSVVWYRFIKRAQQLGFSLIGITELLMLRVDGQTRLMLGQMFAHFGTQVTLVTRGRRLLSGYEPEIASALTEILQEEGLRIVTSSQVRGVARAEEGVALNVLRQGRVQMFTADKLLIATGRCPNTQGLKSSTSNSRREGCLMARRSLHVSRGGRTSWWYSVQIVF